MIAEKQMTKIADFLANIDKTQKTVFLIASNSGSCCDEYKTTSRKKFLDQIKDICGMPLSEMAGEIDFNAKIGKDWYQIATRTVKGKTVVDIVIDNQNAEWYNNSLRQADSI